MEDCDEIIKRLKTSNNIVKESIKQLMMASMCMDNYIKLLTNPFGVMTLIMSNDMEKELDKYTNQINYWFQLAGQNMQAAGEYLGGNKKGEENKNGEENNSI